jgi:hypothetical protein
MSHILEFPKDEVDEGWSRREIEKRGAREEIVP